MAAKPADNKRLFEEKLTEMGYGPDNPVQRRGSEEAMFLLCSEGKPDSLIQGADDLDGAREHGRVQWSCGPEPLLRPAAVVDLESGIYYSDLYLKFEEFSDWEEVTPSERIADAERECKRAIDGDKLLKQMLRGKSRPITIFMNGDEGTYHGKSFGSLWDALRWVEAQFNGPNWMRYPMIYDGSDLTRSGVVHARVDIRDIDDPKPLEQFDVRF